MGCCSSRGRDGKAEEGNDKGKNREEVRGEEVKLKSTNAKTSLQASKGLILHVNPASAPNFSQVFRLLAGNLTIEQRPTPDLSSIPGLAIKQYPVAEINGKVLSGERVIARYLAQQQGLYPIGATGIYECESLVELVEDSWKLLATGDETCIYQVAEILQDVERRLKHRYFGGENPNYADIVVFCFLTTFYLHEEVREEREGAVPVRLKCLVDDLKTTSLLQQLD